MDGVAITYDAIGNPLNDGTWTYTWQNGRQLARMQSVDIDASFFYNENGLRIQKTVNGIVTDYTLHGKNIVHMMQGSDELHFFYSTDTGMCQHEKVLGDMRNCACYSDSMELLHDGDAA